MKHEDYIKTLQSSEGTASFREDNKESLHPVKEQFLADIRSGKAPMEIHGVFGPETPDSDGYIQEVITPKGGGKYIKLYGCGYYLRGTYDGEIVKGLQMAKTLVSDSILKFLKNPFILLGILGAYIFTSKKFIEAIDYFFSQIEHRVSKAYKIPNDHHNVYSLEIKRAVSIALPKGSVWNNIIIRFVDFLCLVLETDTAYRFRLQDAIYEAGKTGLTLSGIFDVLISRETPSGIARKWRQIRVGLFLLRIASPAIRKVLDTTIKNLKSDKFKMDENDWYFCLRFKSYNFGGKTEKERLFELKQLDFLKGNIYL